MAHSYPGSDLTFTQLLYALNRKLDMDATSCISIRANFDLKILSKLDTIIIRSQAQIRSFRNAFSPINRLNPETLSYIFGFVKDICMNCTKKDIGGWSVPYGWIAVSHVCRYWRNSALCFPSTWAYVDSKSPAIAQLCIERSKFAPLGVWLRSGCHEDFFLALQPHIRRVRNLAINLSSPEDLPLLLHFAGVSAPVLNILELRIDRANNRTTDIAPQIPPLFQENMPSLTHLHISGFSVGGLISHVSNLTELRLCHDNPQLAPSMTKFLDFLESNPNLSFMTIKSAGPRLEDGNRNRIVHLRSLVKLTLGRCAVKMILGHLSLPLKTSIAIGSIQISRGSSLMKETLPTSLEQLTNLHELERIGFSRHGETSCSFAADGASGSIAINANLKIPNDDPNPVLSSSSFLRSVPPLSVAYIRYLWLENIRISPDSDSKNGPKKVVLRNMFRSMPNLDTLTLIQCNSDSIFQALQPNGDAIFCDALVSITMFDNDLYCSDLLTLAANRAAAGAAFEHISVICSPRKFVSGVEIMKLKKYVQKVEYKIDDEVPEWPFKDLPVLS